MMLQTNQLKSAAMLIFGFLTATQLVEPSKLLLLGTVTIIGYIASNYISDSENREEKKIKQAQEEIDTSTLFEKFIKSNRGVRDLLLDMKQIQPYDKANYNHVVKLFQQFLTLYYKRFMQPATSVTPDQMMELIELRETILDSIGAFALQSSAVTFHPVYMRIFKSASQIMYNYIKTLENKNKSYYIQAVGVQKEHRNF